MGRYVKNDIVDKVSIEIYQVYTESRCARTNRFFYLHCL
jgi:hypothetical protein